MDEFDVGYLKFKKSTAMSRFRRLFRFAELIAAVVLLVWLSARAPIAAKASSDYLCRLCSAVASPIFVFFLGNAIVVALFAKSGNLSRGNVESEICEEMSNNVPAAAEEEIVFQDKQVIVCEEVVKRNTPLEAVAVENRNPRVSDSELLYRRSKSEKTEKCEDEILRRSKTDLCRKTESEENEPVGDGMSSEVFRRTIEEFIAKQALEDALSRQEELLQYVDKKKKKKKLTFFACSLPGRD